MKFVYLVLLLFFILVPSKSAGAAASVSTGTGKIEIIKPLEVNLTTKIDSITIYNDGNEAGLFEMLVMFNETQPEHKPKKEWIKFSPQIFSLEAGKSQQVNVAITIPNDAKSGEYFAYLESHLLKTANPNNGISSTSISEAVATKLMFKVPGNQSSTKQHLKTFTMKTTPFILSPEWIQPDLDKIVINLNTIAVSLIL